MGQKLPLSVSGARRVDLKGPVPLEKMASKHSSARPKGAAPERHEPSPPMGGGAAIDLPSLARAVRRSVGHDGMRREDAEAIAANILNFFGFNERIIDNVLEPDDRDTFYMLEDCGILETERDETTLYDGREWRIHYWMFRKERILQLAKEEAEASPDEEATLTQVQEPRYHPPITTAGISIPHVNTDVYDQLSDEVWSKDEEEGAPAAELPQAQAHPSRFPRGPSSVA